jgi:hypothetical protein
VVITCNFDCPQAPKMMFSRLCLASSIHVAVIETVDV